MLQILEIWQHLEEMYHGARSTDLIAVTSAAMKATKRRSVRRYNVATSAKRQAIRRRTTYLGPEVAQYTRRPTRDRRENEARDGGNWTAVRSSVTAVMKRLLEEEQERRKTRRTAITIPR